MSLRSAVENASQYLVDLIFMVIPRRRPSRQAALDCKIVSHRGEHDNRQIRENTIDAFERVSAAGIWGIEFDVRWTSDLKPVVIHDANAWRVFGIDLEVNETTLAELGVAIPQIPTLEQVVEQYGGRLHLMVELKHEQFRDRKVQAEHLRRLFGSLRAGVDYHFIGLHEEVFTLVAFAGESAFLPVAELNLDRLSRMALERNYAGVCGHYLLLNSKIIRSHRNNRQGTGSGFSASRFCFYRELDRGVDWIFTNHALKLRSIRQSLLRDR